MTDGQITFEQLPIRTGAVAGAVGWVAGLVVTAFLVGGRGGVPGTIFAYSTLHLWYLLFVQQGVNTAGLVFSIVPMTILAAAGYVVASRTDVRGWIPVGLAVAVGYLGLALPSHLLVLRPSLLLAVAVLFTGVVMPLVFAGLGGTFVREPADADPE